MKLFRLRHALMMGCAVIGAQVITSAAAPAYGQAAVREFAIPAQPVAEALRAFANATGRDVLFAPSIVAGKRSPGVKGALSETDALRTLLAGTGLKFEVTSANGYAVMAAQAQAAPADVQRQAQQETPPSGSGETTSQSADEESRPTAVEKVTVTGSRIRGRKNDASPSQSLDRDDFDQSGATSVQQIMRQLPQNFSGGASEVQGALSTGRNGASNNNAYGAGINLRGLGNASTLVLLNGRRMAPGGLGSFVDVSTIPLSALERIDVVTDGSSAIYGSDAVGGVVNFILRNNFDGVETSARYGGVTDGSLREFNANILGGVTWDSGSALVNVDYGKREALLASERDFASALNEAGGPTYLTPSDERMGFLFNGHQDLTDALTFSATVYANVRDAQSETARQAMATQFSFFGTTNQVGGTLSLDWRTANEWIVTLAQTNARSDVDRTNIYTPPLFGLASNGAVIDHTLSATEIEAEGPLFAMPGGDARVAIGAEHRSEGIDVTPVSFVPAITTPTTSFRRTVDAAYVEAYLPIIGEPNRTPYAHRLDLTAAVRYENYSDVGETANSKLGLLWSPVEAVNLRATYGTSFRAPYLWQYDASSAVGIYFDAPNPSSPTGSTRLAALLQAPDPGLGPETATTWTAGFDIDPEILFDFRVTGTYFDIDYQDRISAAGFSFVAFLDPALASLVSVPADAEILAQVALVEANNPPNFLNITFPLSPLTAAEATFDGRTRNQSSSVVSGFDLTIDRVFDTEFGEFNVGVNASYIFEFKNQITEGGPVVDSVDTIFNPIDLRVRGYASYTNGSWQASTIVNYADNYKDTQLPTTVRIVSWTTIDLSLAYTFAESVDPNDGLTIRLNAINVFDEDPPHVTDVFLVPGSGFGNPGFDPENANPLGRIVSLTVTKRW